MTGATDGTELAEGERLGEGGGGAFFDTDTPSSKVAAKLQGASLISFSSVNIEIPGSALLCGVSCASRDSRVGPPVDQNAGRNRNIFVDKVASLAPSRHPPPFSMNGRQHALLEKFLRTSDFSGFSQGRSCYHAGNNNVGPGLVGASSVQSIGCAIQDTLTVWGPSFKANRPGAVRKIHVARLKKNCRASLRLLNFSKLLPIKIM